MWTSVVLLVLTVVFFQSTHAQDVACSYDAAGTRGRCLPVSRCPKLLQYVRIASDRSRSAAVREALINRLRQLSAKCATPANRSLVCCQSEPTRTAPTRPVAPPIRTTVTLPDDCGRVSLEGKIISGVDADIGQFPWMASIQYSNDGSDVLIHNCGGTLITSRHVVTAAHCLSAVRPLIPEQVILGEVDFGSEKDCLAEDPRTCAPPPVSVGIEAFKTHPGFENIDQLAYPNDIAIIKLVRDVAITGFVRPICLLQNPADLGRANYDDLTVNASAIIAGWGQFNADDSTSIFSERLQYAKVPVQPVEMCREAFDLRVPFSPGRICAGGAPDMADTCRGDSGGPLMFSNRFGTKFYQIGVSSFGLQRCGTVAAYTRTMDYIDWIKETITIL